MPDFEDTSSPTEQVFRQALRRADELEEKYADLLEEEFLKLGAKVVPSNVRPERWALEDMLREVLGSRESLNRVLEQLVEEAAILGATEGDRILSKFLQSSTKSVIYLDSAWELVNMSVVDWIRTRHWFSPLSLAQGLTTTEQSRIRALVVEQIADRHPQAWLREQIRGVNGLYSRRRAEIIARTEVTHAFARGNRSAWEGRGVQRVSWRTRVDELVCPICGPLHQQIFPIDSDVIPPAHTNCRCWIVPVVDRSAYISPKKPTDS